MTSLNSKSLKVPESIQPRFQKIAYFPNKLRKEKLNSEFGELCRELSAALARKRSSPIIGGQAKSWACGVVYTIGYVNVLFDKSQHPLVRANELCVWFGVDVSTGGNKAKQIRDMLGIHLLDRNWKVPSEVGKHSKAWMISVNKFVVDVRLAP